MKLKGFYKKATHLTRQTLKGEPSLTTGKSNSTFFTSNYHIHCH